MRTLVIHPKDRTTDFLSKIYEGKNWTVVTDEMSRKSLERFIKQHDRIVMLGHGDERGMFGHGKYVINSSTMWYLRNKKIVAVWCNADVFVKRHRLRGFYTGMIISETDEATMYCIDDFSEDQIDASNVLFADSISKHIDSNDILDRVKSEYVDDSNPIISFNKHNIYQS